jgi:hypothetical protein
MSAHSHLVFLRVLAALHGRRARLFADPDARQANQAIAEAYENLIHWSEELSARRAMLHRPNRKGVEYGLDAA